MEALFRQVEDLIAKEPGKLPPVEKWTPALSGDLDMRIGKDGQWFYQGSAIKRQPLVKLFSSILKREGDDYFLVTPVEKWRIQVDNAPFLVVNFAQDSDENGSLLRFKTTTDDIVVADKEHPIWMEQKPGESTPQPYLMIRGNMPGLIHRNLFYQLVDFALGQEEGGGTDIVLRSRGERFVLK